MDDNGSTAAKDILLYKSLESDILGADDTLNEQSIKDFLQRPYKVYASTISGSASPGTVIASGNLCGVFQLDYYSRKLEGFMGIRADAKVKIEINATPLQSGLLMLAWLPYGQAVSGREQNQKYIQGHHLIGDISCDTAMELSIPHQSFQPYHNLIKYEALTINDGDFGNWYLTTFTNTRSVASPSDIGVTIWVSFSNVELVTPAAQANIPEQEDIQQGGKPISGGLKLASRAMESFARVPLLTSVAQPASWVLDYLSGIANTFGFSKPTSQDPPNRVIQNFSAYGASCDGVDMCLPSTVSIRNSITLMDFDGSKLDEMNLNYLCSRPGLVGLQSWTTSGVVGEVLYTNPVDPIFTGGAQYATAVTNGLKFSKLTPMGYFSQFFELWRGSLVFRFRFAKTKLHSGRLVFIFNPYVGVSPNTTNNSYVIREVIDIRERSVFEFTVPYMALTPYLKTVPVALIPGGYPDYEYANGCVSLSILNVLRAPSATVPTTIDFSIEVFAGQDFELAQPKLITAKPYLAGSEPPEDPELMHGGEEPIFEAQMNIPKDDSCLPLRKGVGGTSIAKCSVKFAEFCIGEKIDSILQLLKKFTIIVSAATIEANTYIYWMPYSSVNSIADNVDYNICPGFDYYNLFYPCYGFSRGSVRVRLVDHGSKGLGNMGATVQVYPDYAANFFTESLTSNYSSITSTLYTSSVSHETTGIELRVPPCSQSYYRVNYPISDGFGKNMTNSSSSSSPIVVKFFNGSSTSLVEMARGVGEDFQFRTFVSVPDLIVRTA